MNPSAAEPGELVNTATQNGDAFAEESLVKRDLADEFSGIQPFDAELRMSFQPSAFVEQTVMVFEALRKARRVMRVNVPDRETILGNSGGESASSARQQEHKPRYSLGLGGGNSRALHSEENPLRPWEPSQKGLFSASPQRHREMTVRPAKPYSWPSTS